jgi:hypothetical protein
MKSLGGFVLRFALVFGLLAWPWPWLRQGVSVCFRAQARILASLIFPAHTFRVEAFSSGRFPTLDTCVIVADPENTGPDGQSRALEIPFDSGAQGWIPLAMLIALVIATPLPWARRWKALLAGALAIQLLVAATILASVGIREVGLIEGGQE